MRVYKLPIQKYEEFCELCSEYHEYINCPICGEEILEIYEGKVARCADNHVFSVWERGESAVIVKCEHIYVARFAKVKCDEESRSGHLADPASWNDNFTCCEERCPLRKGVQ